MKKSRTEMAAKNVVWAYANTFVTTVLKFACRWAFIRTIGATYLGINGLYTSILHVLSLTELGIGTAMNYSLYKPVAENDREKIKSLMVYYKKAYTIIAAVVAGLGVAIIPFLPKLIKGAEGTEHLVLYYVLFLFNTVSSYFVSYKYSLAGADQKTYVVNNINTAATIIMNIIQIIALFVFKSFLIYLIVQIVCLLIGKIYASVYLDKMYPFLKEKDVKPVDKQTKDNLFKNVRALVVHKLGDVAVNQTDSIIISSVINIVVTGLISNYTLIIGTVQTFLVIMFSNITGSLGNLCATSTKQKQLEIFKAYDFVSFWLYGFAFIAYLVLIQPFSELMWGKEYVVDNWVVLLIIINFYLVGRRIPLTNMKIAAGVFQEDRLLPLIQAVVNLVVSIFLAKRIGLIGIYIGTIVSGLVPTLFRPILVYRKLFDESSANYFMRFGVHMLIVFAIGAVTYLACMPILSRVTWIRFFCAMAVTAILPNAILFILYRKTDEFEYMRNVSKRIIGKLLRRKKSA